MWKKILLFILVLNAVADTVSADTGGYIVGPCPPEEELEKLGDAIDMSGADKTLTFWEFPLSFKIAYIIGYLAIFVSVFKMAPVILGQMRNLNKRNKRKKIIDYVLKKPGCTSSEISKELKITRGCVRYHLKTLKIEEKLTLIKERKFTRAFQNYNAFTNNEKTIIAHLKGGTRKQILLNILENPGITNQEISEKLSLDKSTTHWHIKKLREDDIIISEAEWKFSKYIINPAVETDLLKWLKT